MAVLDDDDKPENGGDNCREDCLWKITTQGIPCHLYIHPVMEAAVKELGLVLNELRLMREDWKDSTKHNVPVTILYLVVIVALGVNLVREAIPLMRSFAGLP